MKYWYQKPHPSLSEYVRTVLILEGFAEPITDNPVLFTNGMSALFCRTEKNEEGNETPAQLTLFAKSTPAECWSVNNNTTIIAYFFKPFALAAMFNVAVAALSANPVDLCDWNAHNTNALKTQLLYASSTAMKISVVDNLLIHQLQQQLRECELIRYATDEMMCNPGTEILSKIMDASNINERTFQRMFKKYVGITPMQYRRICQFQVSFAQVRAKQFNKLTEVAFDNGFADQSHFIRSFKEFTETTPNDYLRSGLKQKNK